MGTTHTFRTSVSRAIAVAVAVALLWVHPAAARSVSALPRSDYSAHPVCAAPRPHSAACLAVQLVPRTAQARAHTHPIGIASAASAGTAAVPSPAAGDFGLRPRDLHAAYQLPTSAPGTQTIALVDPYNDLNAQADLSVYSKEFGLPECTATGGCFVKVNQNGEGANLPFPQNQASLASEEALCDGSAKATRHKREEACLLVGEVEGWSVEVSLDIETAHATCQSCHIALVESNSPSFANLEAAENAAANLGAGEISDSWAGAECQEGFCIGDGSAFNHPGVVITAAAGDRGYLNWLEEPRSSAVDFPASSPQVVAVGGTRLDLGAEGKWLSESVWNDGGESSGLADGYGAGGSGCSAQFTAPPWQQSVAGWASVGCGEKRAVADVAADADPYSGLAVYDTSPECEYAYEESGEQHLLHWCTIGGTSLASPLIASVFALAGGANDVQYPAQTLYESERKVSASLHDVSEGSNGECLAPFDEYTGLPACTASEQAERSCPSQTICRAAPDYDGPTGVGTPNGIAGFAPTRAPTATTGTASAITQTSATLNASVDPNGREVSECELEYGTTTAYGASAPCTPSPGAGNAAVALDAPLAGLSADTTYHYRVVATSSGGTSDGADRTFTTLADGIPPAIDSESASRITQSDATLEAQINPNGLETEYEVVVEDPCPAPMECIRDVAAAKASLPASSTAQPVSVNLATSGSALNIEPDTTYSYWVVAKNAAGPPTEGPHETFKTLPVPPRVATGAASSITQSAATLSASVDPAGAEVLTCAIEYGTNSSYGSSAPCNPTPGSGSSPVSVSASLASLTAATTYHYRVIATNAGGTSEGIDATFTTQLPTTLTAQIPGGEGTTTPSQGTSSHQGVSASQERRKPPVPDAELLSTSLTASAAGMLSVRVSCPATESRCTGTVTLRTLGAMLAGARASASARATTSILKIAAASFTVAGEHATTVRLRLSAKARTLLATAHLLRARASVFARDPAGATHTTQSTVTIHIRLHPPPTN